MISDKVSLKKGILLLISAFILLFAGVILGLKTYSYFENKNAKPALDISTTCNYYQRLADLHWAQTNNYKSEQTRAFQEQRHADWVTWTQKYEMEKSVAEDFENQYQDCKTKIRK